MGIQSVRWLRFVPVAALALFALLIAQPALAQGSDPTSAAEVEIVGPVEVMNGSTITVNSLVVDVSAARVQVTLEVGLAVRVEGTLLENGTVRAREVNAAGPAGPALPGLLPGEVEIVGTLTAYEGATAVVDGLTFDLSSAEIKDTLAVGDLVKVHASLLPDGTWVVREIELFTFSDNRSDNASDDRREGEVELVGTLTEIGADFIVVAGLTIDTTGAEMDDPLVVGALVKVHMTLVDGAWVAREVETAPWASQGGDDDRNDDSGRGSDDGPDDDHGGSSGRGGDDDQNDDHGGDSGRGGDDDRDDDHGDDYGDDD